MSEKKVNLEPFAFTGNSPLWDNIVLLIKENIEAESSYAVGDHDNPEKRAWACGRASSLRDLLDYIEETRREAQSKY